MPQHFVPTCVANKSCSTKKDKAKPQHEKSQLHMELRQTRGANTPITSGHGVNGGDGMHGVFPNLRRIRERSDGQFF